jgi:hypothetical protein
MKNWSYSCDGKTHDMVSEEELNQLILSGHLEGDTQIWTEGQSTWTKIKDSEFAGQLQETAVCAVSGRTMSKSKMLQYGDDWVDPVEKDNFVERLMQGKAVSGAVVPFQGAYPYQSPEKPGTIAKWLIVASSAYTAKFSGKDGRILFYSLRQFVDAVAGYEGDLEYHP